MRKSIIAGNWKLNGDRQLCHQFVARLNGCDSQAELLLMPPAVYLGELSMAIAQQGVRLNVGAQNVASQQSGAFTGEISADMLLEAGVQYCLAGHSERRSFFAESNAQVATKAQRLLEVGITPVVCVGEDEQTRDSGAALDYVALQITEVLRELELDRLDSMVIAYEPVWAIGTGNTATAEQVQKMHAHIRSIAGQYGDAESLSILYGGSVKPSNAGQLLSLADVDGALVGGASLDIEQFLAIAKCA